MHFVSAMRHQLTSITLSLCMHSCLSAPRVHHATCYKGTLCRSALFLVFALQDTIAWLSRECALWASLHFGSAVADIFACSTVQVRYGRVGCLELPVQCGRHLSTLAC